MAKRLIVLVALLVAMLPTIVFGQSQAIPREIPGVEITRTRGWFSNLYFWKYVPEWATVHPLPEFHTPGEFPSPGEIKNLIRMLKAYGSGVDVIEYNPNPTNPDHNQILSSGYLSDPEFKDRPFFLLYEHVFGTRYILSPDGSINMDLPYNQQVMRDDIDWMFRQIIMPNQSRYVTFDKRAVIYFWSVVSMYGDLGSLLDELRAKYPVAFLGSINLLDRRVDQEHNFKALDGFMEYGLYPGALPNERDGGKISYSRMRQAYSLENFLFGLKVRDWESQLPRRKYLRIPTFQFAFDDTRYPGRRNTPMYPESKAEVEFWAGLFRDAMRDGAYNNIGPFVVVNEWYEGAAAGPSQCTPETLDRPGRWIGCGYGRLEILRKYFGVNR